MAKGRQSYEFTIDQGLAIVGSPDTVIRKLEAAKKAIGFDIFCTNHEIGKMPREMTRSSIDLFSKYVLPEFRSSRGGEELDSSVRQAVPPEFRSSRDGGKLDRSVRQAGAT
jgi:hypothetical protein